MKQPFHIHIESSVIDDLKLRLSKTRWTDEIENEKWEYGTNEAYLKQLCDYWQRDFDWQKQEEYLNSFAHFTTTIDDISLHFIHEKGKGKNAIPLLLTHGYPDSFVRFVKLIPLLTEEDDNRLSFDVIVPSIPGYGFSDKPVKPGMNPKQIANLFGKMMTEELGYDAFYAQGGDWGSSITEQIALQYANHVRGIHLTDVPFQHLFTVRKEDLTLAEKKYLAEGKKWQQTEGGYAMIQGTKPQTLGYALNDSPAGLAAWIIEKFRTWSDCQGNIESIFSKDELLTNLTIYWATETINSANRLYYETMHHPSLNTMIKSVKVPTAVAIFPKDLLPAPREYAERFFNIRRWTEMPVGGHFAAMEQPALLARDIREFVQEQKSKE